MTLHDIKKEMFIFCLICTTFISCDSKQIENQNISVKVGFKEPILDTFNFYISKVNIDCDIVMAYDRNIMSRISRFNFFTLDDKSMDDFNFIYYTEIDNKRINIITGIENFVESSNNNTSKFSKSKNCVSTFFVVYDSAGHIFVKENFNSFNENFSPQKQPEFRAVKPR